MSEKFPWDNAPKRNAFRATEGGMNNAAKKALNALEGCECFKHHGSVLGEAGHSDLYGVYRFMPFYIEGKMENNKPTKNQELFLAKMKEVGACVGIYHSKEEAVKIVVEGYEAWRCRLFGT